MKETNIEWCDSTINGTSGCGGCELWNKSMRTCYAGQVHENRLAHSYPANYAASFSEVRVIPGRLVRAADWTDLTGKERPEKPWLNGRPRHIFVGDMGDFLSAAVPEEFIKREVLGAAESKNGKRHVWQWLTKRPERLAELSAKWGGLPDNVIAMTTVTDQRTADLRVPSLLRVKAKTRGLSCEPLLGPVDLRRAAKPAHIDGNVLIDGLDWVIVGGESGHGARPMHPAWARSLRDQCAAAGVPFFFKQWGEWVPWTRGAVFPAGIESDFVMLNGSKYQPGNFSSPCCSVMRVGKKNAGRFLDGFEHNGFPA